MPWAKWDDRAWSHPKLIQVGLAGTGLFARSLSYSVCYLSDGFVPESWVKVQLDGEDVELPARLVKAGLWSRAKGGFRIHDFADYNPTKAEWKATSDRKRQAARKRWDAPGNARSNAEPEPEPDPNHAAAIDAPPRKP